jgi:two-component system cell cycle response regulator DivK
MSVVLVVEDNPANMKLTTLQLRHAGYQVLAAADAETGLMMAQSERPDLILMDLQLPGMDGLAATALLKGDVRTAGIPVVALTAMAWQVDRQKSKAAGCDAYISKPVAYRELLDVIGMLLATPSGVL